MKRRNILSAARRWQALAWGGAMLLGLATGCAVKNPEVPRTKFKISIPVADDRTMISEVVEGRDYLKLDESGRMALDFTADFGDGGRRELGDRLGVKPRGSSFSTQIGDIEIPGQPLPENRIPMSALVPGVSAGTAALIPASDIDTQVAVPLADIQALAIKEGSLSLTLRNGLPVNLTDMQMTLVDEGNGGVVVDRVDLGRIPADGGEQSGIFVLSGKSISGSLAIQVTGRTEEAANVEVSSDASLDVVGRLNDLTVTEIRGLIPQQQFEDHQSLEFPDDRIQITEAIIRKGRLTFEVTNNVPLVMQLDIVLDDLSIKKPDGSDSVLVFQIERLDSSQTTTADFPLEGSAFSPDNALQLRFSYFAKTIPSDEPASLVSGSDIGVQAITDTLAFSEVRGILNRLSLPLPSTDKEIAFPDGLDNIFLNTSSLAVYLTSAVGFRSELDLHLEGTSKSGRQGSLNINAVIERGDPENPRQQILAPSSTELTDFLNVLPSQISVDPDVLLGDGVGEEVIRPADWVQIDSVVFKAPARLRIAADTQIRPEVQKRDFQDEEARRRIEANLDSATVVTDIENHLPIGVRVSLMVGTARETVYTNPILRIPHGRNSWVEPDSLGGFGVEAAPVDAQGRVKESEKSTRSYAITAEEVLVFLRPDGVYTGILIELDQTAGGGEIDVLGTDFVDVKAATQIFMELNEDLVE